jgi:hypothetical protein
MIEVKINWGFVLPNQVTTILPAIPTAQHMIMYQYGTMYSVTIFLN